MDIKEKPAKINLREEQKKWEKEKAQKTNRVLKRLMSRLPFLIFLQVADADGEIDPGEVRRFREILYHGTKNCESRYTKRMMHRTLLNHKNLFDQFATKTIQKDLALIEKAMKLIFKIAGPAEYELVCKDFKNLAEEVAKASGKVLGFGNPVSSEEKNILDKLQELFLNPTNPEEEEVEGSA